jgi:SPP1 gp7 family putative phage head morphogenesis protein
MANSTTAAKAPPGAVYEMADAFQSDLDAGVTAANDQVLAAWAEAYAQTRADYDGLLAKIAAAQANGQPLSPAWLYQKDRLKNALATTKAQIHTFAQQASESTVQAHKAAVQASAYAHAKMGAQAMQEAGLAGGFTKINEANLTHLVGFLHDGSPVDALFTSLATETADMARDAFVRGLTLGKGVDWITRRLEQALDVPRWRAETIVRTEAQRVYRSVARQTYMANDDVLEGWVWKAHLDSRTCPACMSMDGTVHAVGSTLDGHQRCRCAMVPRTKSWADLGVDGLEDQRPPIRTGQDWFKAQPSTVQRAMLGPRKYHAWKGGEITLDDLVARHSHPVWGTQRRERSMLEIKAGKGANYPDKVEVSPPAAPVLAADPSAVQSISATHTLDEIEATLESMPLTEQGRLNFLAAHQVKVAELPKGPTFRMPEPDLVLANKGTEKMNAAVLSKGYPSKGYSQTVATYKAKANGTPGQKVGVVKSLTWQQKVDAQKALADHDAWLVNHLATKQAAKAEGKSIVKGFDEDFDTALSHAMAKDDYMQAKTAAKFSNDPIEGARAEAILDAKWAKYGDEQVEAYGFHEASPDWVNSDSGYGLTIDGDTGWGSMVDLDGVSQPLTLKPGQVAAMLKDGKGWDVPKVEPDPTAVASMANNIKTKDGFYDEAFAKTLEDSLNDPQWVAASGPQQVANVTEAINVAKATLPWKPEQSYVDKIVKMLDDDPSIKPHLIHTTELPGTKPLSKANILEAIKQHEAKVAAKAENSPLPAAKAPKAPKAQKVADKPAGYGAAPDPATLKPTGQTLGTHGAKVYTDPQGNRWLFKPPVDTGDAFLSTLDEAASRLQSMTGLKAPDTYVTTIGGKRGSLQRMFDVKGDAFPGGLKPATLTEPDLLAVQKEQVLDWLLSNHDGHYQQFLRMPDGSVVGVDKGQAFRWMGQDRLDWDFHPNASYGAPEPVYNTLWRSFAQGDAKVEALDPRHGPLADYIKSVQGISDDEVRALFRPYAEQAAARGKLAVRQTQPGLTMPKIPANDVDAFLDAIVARKNGLGDDFAALYDKAAKARAQALPEWKPAKPKAVKGTTGKAKWKDKPAPEKPETPKPPSEAAAPVFDPWLAKVKAKYEAYAPGKKLEASNNWARVRRVIDDRDRKAVAELLDRHYLDQAMADEALALIDEAEQVAKAAEAVHAKAVQAYERAMTKWKRDTKAWRDANGITSGQTVGMDAGKRQTDTTGNTWGRKVWDAANKVAHHHRTHIQTYSGSSFTEINSTGRRLGKGKAADHKSWGSWSELVRNIDEAFEEAPRVPTDTVLVRGTGVDSFTLNGRLLGSHESHLLDQLVGTVQRDEGFMSSSVGRIPGYGSGQAVQMKILAPAGSKAIYIDPISLNQGEREMLLPRGTNLYVHAVYKQNGRTVVEAEIVDDDFIPPTGPNGEPIVTPATKAWDWP